MSSVVSRYQLGFAFHAGSLTVPFSAFMTGPKRNVRARDELVTAVEWADAGPAQVFMKVGTRNAMVIAVAGLALVADRARKRVGVGHSTVYKMIAAGEFRRQLKLSEHMSVWVESVVKLS